MCEADRHTEISINRLYFGYHCRLTSPLLISISVLFSPTFSWPPVSSPSASLLLPPSLSVTKHLAAHPQLISAKRQGCLTVEPGGEIGGKGHSHQPKAGSWGPLRLHTAEPGAPCTPSSRRLLLPSPASSSSPLGNIGKTVPRNGNK